MSFAAYFARVGRKGTGLSPPISGGEEIVFSGKTGEVKHPLSGKMLPPKPLFGAVAKHAQEPDRRAALASWITAPENPYFTQVIVNRVWADLMGRGIVEPVDDLRATNPPSNTPLLEALADDFRDHGYDLKHLIRTITTSYVYGLSSLPNHRNIADTRNYSRHYRQRLRAEVLLERDLRRHRRAGDDSTPRRPARGPMDSGRFAPSRCSSTRSAGPTRTRIPPASDGLTRRSSRSCM